MRTDHRESAEVAARAARAGGDIVLAGAAGDRANPGGDDVTEKGAGDYVTEVDLASEAEIRALLERAMPGVPVIGEEAGSGSGDGQRGGDAGDRYWLVDPLDGTTNFIHGFPVVGVSVALIADGRPVAGAVHAPFLGLTWLGSSGGGAVRREDAGREFPLRIADRPVSRAVVATGFPFRHKEVLPRYLPVLEGAFGPFEDLRRPGAAALDLAWVADGTFDGFFELTLLPWDVAAGGLLIREAGGVVTDWTGGDGWLSGDILAGSPAVHATLRELAGRPSD